VEQAMTDEIDDTIAAMAPIEFTLAKMDIQDGDVLVVQFFKDQPVQKANAVLAAFRHLFKRMGVNAEIAIVDSTMALSLMRPQKSSIIHIGDDNGSIN
jgi:hypothetical protein